MVFSSNLFLYIFLPLVLLLYTLVPNRGRNLLLFIISLAFYSWGSGPIVLLLLVSILVNYFAGLLIYRSEHTSKPIFVAVAALNLLLLIYYKYFGFFYAELTKALALLSITLPTTAEIPLPIGISFFTFQAISYLGEIYRKEHAPARNIVDYAMYIALFPHLIAGPIVRYSDISDEIRSRLVNLEGVYEGLWRFALGLGKKVIIANSVGSVADKIFGLPQAEITTATAWVGAMCYTFQIYFDFSGYSDMAIGLARMFGFHFPENFNQPYRATTVTEFWRRWHMSLSRWFRDFVYVPLGGNRRGPIRTYFNLWIVFILCGLWHGAAWTFVIWGLYHGLLLVVERTLRNRFNFETRGIVGNMTTMLLIMIGWVFFRATDLSQAGLFLSAMFGMNAPSQSSTSAGINFYLQSEPLAMLFAGALFSWLPLEKLAQMKATPFLSTLARSVVIVFLIFLSAAILANAAFNPFIYFRF